MVNLDRRFIKIFPNDKTLRKGKDEDLLFVLGGGGSNRVAGVVDCYPVHSGCSVPFRGSDC